MTNTPFSEICNELADTYMNPEYEEFAALNDISVPAAYLIAEGLVTNWTDELTNLIVKTFEDYLKL